MGIRGKWCLCGAPRETHCSDAKDHDSGEDILSQWDSTQHSSEYPTDAFGELEFAGAGTGRERSHFLRLSSDTPPETVYNLMTAHWGVPSPNLVVSVVGGDYQYPQDVMPWVRKVLQQGLVKAAHNTGVWILTDGLSEGVGHYVGEAVRYHEAVASEKKVIAVGVAPWSQVKNRQDLVNPQGSFPAHYHVHDTFGFFLDCNYQAFLLVDDGRADCRQREETAFRANMEDYISHQRNTTCGIGFEIPVLCMLISGEEAMLERVELSLSKDIPWLILAGSGPAANLICEVINDLEASNGRHITVIMGALHEMAKKRVVNYFPEEENLEKRVDTVMSIYYKRHLITMFDGEQEEPDDFDRVILKALVNSRGDPATEMLKLAVAWNRVDIATSDLFNGDIRWKYENLEESMTHALLNDKSQFVRLFTESSLNIREYLTYGRLESLYCSLSNSSPAFKLLQQCTESTLKYLPRAHRPQTPLVGPSSAKQLSLYEVSRLLCVILGNVCEPFYYKPLGLKPGTSITAARTEVNMLLEGECSYRKESCLAPWTSLFIWAVLQNRSEMALHFWEMAGEPVLCALSGCKMLRELSKLESKTETKLSMENLAQKFENLAHDVFTECYQSSESLSFTLLKRTSPVWGGATCLQMATAADARHFFSHDGVQSLLSQIWWGDMERNTEVWKLVLTFFLPSLICTNFLRFRELEEEVKSENLPHGQEMNSLDGEENAEESAALRPNVKGSTCCTLLLSSTQRCRQFWFAPVTVFIGNVLMYLLFLCLFAYVLLVDFKPPPPEGPATLELALYFWVFTLMCEEIRQFSQSQIFFVGSRITLSHRMSIYIQDKWNKCDLTALLLFSLGLCCRMFPWSYEFGRAVMSLDFMVFTLRLVHISVIHQQMGPKIIMVGKMMKDLFFFLLFLAVWLIAYGVANQALLYFYDPRPDRILHRVLYQPYLLIFGMDADNLGEVECTNNSTLIDAGVEPCMSTYANWLVVVLLAVYLLVTNIVLINLLIAMFSYTFSEVQDHSDTYWKFQRYHLIVEYHSKPCLPPPFITFSHLHLFIMTILRFPSSKIKTLVCKLLDGEASRLDCWEAIQKENLLSDSNRRHRESDTEQLKRTSVKVDNVLKQLTHISDQSRRLRQLEKEVAKVQEIMSEICSQNAKQWEYISNMQAYGDSMSSPASQRNTFYGYDNEATEVCYRGSPTAAIQTSQGVIFSTEFIEEVE